MVGEGAANAHALFLGQVEAPVARTARACLLRGAELKPKLLTDCCRLEAGRTIASIHSIEIVACHLGQDCAWLIVVAARTNRSRGESADGRDGSGHIAGHGDVVHALGEDILVRHGGLTGLRCLNQGQVVAVLVGIVGGHGGGYQFHRCRVGATIDTIAFEAVQVGGSRRFDDGVEVVDTSTRSLAVHAHAVASLLELRVEWAQDELAQGLHHQVHASESKAIGLEMEDERWRVYLNDDLLQDGVGAAVEQSAQATYFI
mmetsp:Transcript_8471/g.31288  ORF Transcript_8471/g.31288 Transcript_8471/m.31288 type:complete len:259 (-) Transcript_8471:3426-4202(-)